jgi:hypothetical protein
MHDMNIKTKKNLVFEYYVEGLWLVTSEVVKCFNLLVHNCRLPK